MTDEIEKYEEQRLELADKKQCENCKNKIDRSAKYCPECGEKQPEEPVYEGEVIEENENEHSEEENAEEAEETIEENIEDEENKDI